MRAQRLRDAVLFAALLMFSAIAVPATAKSDPPVAVVGNFFNPGDADAAVFSPDGKIVALPDSGFSPNSMTLWEVASGLPLRTLTHSAFFMASVFTPNGTMLVSGHKDGAIKLWNVETGAVLATLRGKPRAGRSEDPDQVSSLWVDAKGELLVAGDRGGVATIWSLATRQPVRTVKLPLLDKLGNAPNIIAARLTADGLRLVVLAHVSGGGDSVQEFDARSGAEASSFSLPKQYTFAENGFVRDGEAFVLETGANCELDELKLFSFRERATVASVHKPAVCAKPKEGNEPGPPKIFSSPDLTRVIVARDGDPDLRLWDASTRQLERTIRWPDNAGAPKVLGLSRDLKSVAMQETDRVRIRALDTGAAIKDFRRFGVGAEIVAASKDGAQILLQRDQTAGDQAPIDLDLRKVDALQPAAARLTPDGLFTVSDFAPAPMLAVAGNDKGEIRLFSLEAGHDQRKLSVANLASVEKLRLSPDGKALLVLGEAVAKPEDADKRTISFIAAMLDAGDGKIRQSFEAHNKDDYVTALAFSPDGTTFAIGHRDGSAEIWDTRSARLLRRLPIYTEDGDTMTLAFSPDARFLIGGGMFDDQVFAWNLATDKVARVFKMGESVAGYRYATAVAMSRDGKTVVAGLGQRAVSSGDNGAERGGIMVWDAATGKRQFVLRGQRGAIHALTFSPDDKWIVSGSLDGSIRYWDRSDGKLMATAMCGADGRWLVLTEAGFYAGSEGSDEAVAIVRGNNAIPGARVRKQLLRPDLVEQLLKGDPDLRYRDAARKLDLPAVLKSAAQ